MESIIKRAVVQVVVNPSQSPTELVAIPQEIPSYCTPSIDYVTKAVTRILYSLVMLISLLIKKSEIEVWDSFFAKRSCLVLSRLVDIGKRGFLEKSFKNFCSWPMARCLGNDLPSVKFNIDYQRLFGRRVRRVILARVPQGSVTVRKTVNVRSLEFADALLKLKGCCVKVPKEFVEQSFREYKETLSKVEHQVEEVEEEEEEGGKKKEEVGEADVFREPSRTEMLHKAIDKVVNEVFPVVPPKYFGDDDIIPSVSSSLESTRKQGGAWNFIRERQEIGPFASPMLIRYAVVHPAGGMPFPVYGHYCDTTGEFVYNGQRVRARVSPVLEPCKVRWISIGESAPYLKAKAWNRLVYRYLPRHPTFALTGRPLEVGDFQGFTQKYLLSGDYKGATDTLKSSISNYTLLSITKRLYKKGNWFQRYNGLRSSLTGHTLEYGDQKFDQETGQLMGSFLSFPILCIVNAAVNRLYLDPTLETPLRDLPLKINGDDVAACSDKDFSDWSDTICLAGFKLSLGKNYVHQDVMCINSQFLRRLKSGAFKECFPIRLNLVFGQDSDGDGGIFGNHVSRPEHLQLCTLGAMARTLVEGRPAWQARSLLKFFIRENSATLKSSSRSWWTPEELGGVGLPYRYRTSPITPQARRIASYLMTRPQPEDVLLYAPRGSPTTTFACQKWMRDCKEVLVRRGYVFTWLHDEEKDSPPPIPLKHYVGYDASPAEKTTRDHYHKLAKLVATEQWITPCLDSTLLRFSEKPRKAGWVRLSSRK